MGGSEMLVTVSPVSAVPAGNLVRDRGAVGEGGCEGADVAGLGVGHLDVEETRLRVADGGGATGDVFVVPEGI